MLEQLRKNWWIEGLRGVAAVFFGIGALVWPGMTLVVLVALFAAYALVEGIFAIVVSFRYRKENESWWTLSLHGVVSVLAGLVAWFLPGLTALTFVFLLAGWAIASGVFGTISAIRLRKEIKGEWLYVLAGLASIVFGVLIALRPGAGALALVWMIGAYAIIFGGLMIGFAFWIRGLGKELPPERPAAARSSEPACRARRSGVVSSMRALSAGG